VRDLRGLVLVVALNSELIPRSLHVYESIRGRKQAVVHENRAHLHRFVDVHALGKEVHNSAQRPRRNLQQGRLSNRSHRIRRLRLLMSFSIDSATPSTVTTRNGSEPSAKDQHLGTGLSSPRLDRRATRRGAPAQCWPRPSGSVRTPEERHETQNQQNT
jgi:hypothetical protein